MDGTADAIAQAYRDQAKGATLIFAVSVEQCHEIAKRIPGAEVITGKTKDRGDIIERFTNREIPCLVNCMVFTEGTDIPLVETVIIARPTQSDSLYTQMVGRGLRLHPEKSLLRLIDCVGVTGKASLCTAPSLLGIDPSDVPASRQDALEGMLFELPEKIEAASDCPQSWIKNTQIVDLWAKEQKYNTHDINWFMKPNGDMVCNLLNRERIIIPCQNELGMTTFNGKAQDMQSAFDEAFQILTKRYSDSKYIWDLNSAKRWGKQPASDKQKQLIQRRGKKILAQSGFELEGLTKLQASQILNRLVG